MFLLFKGSTEAARIIFSKVHPIIKKWTYPQVFGSGPIANYIRSNSESLNKMYKSPLPCTSSAFAFWFRTRYEKCEGVNAERVFVDVPDGGVLGLDKMTLTDKQASLKSSIKPIILVFPGGNETTYSTKVQTLCKTFLQNGFNDIFMCNYRGRCNTPLKTPQFTFPFVYFNDIHPIVQCIEKTYPDRQILLTGDCFGANFIMDYISSDNCKNNSSVMGAVFHSIQWNSYLSGEKLAKEPYFSLFVKPWGKMTKNLLVNGKKCSEDFGKVVLEKIGKDNYAIIQSLDNLWKRLVILRPYR